MSAVDPLDALKAIARRRALGVCLAVAKDDPRTLLATLREASGEPGGVVLLIDALARASNANAAALAPEDWLEQLEFLAVAEGEL